MAVFFIDFLFWFLLSLNFLIVDEIIDCVLLLIMEIKILVLFGLLLKDFLNIDIVFSVMQWFWVGGLVLDFLLIDVLQGLFEKLEGGLVLTIGGSGGFLSFSLSGTDLLLLGMGVQSWAGWTDYLGSELGSRRFDEFDRGRADALLQVVDFVPDVESDLGSHTSVDDPGCGVAPTSSELAVHEQVGLRHEGVVHEGMREWSTGHIVNRQSSDHSLLHRGYEDWIWKNIAVRTHLNHNLL